LLAENDRFHIPLEEFRHANEASFRRPLQRGAVFGIAVSFGSGPLRSQAPRVRFTGNLDDYGYIGVFSSGIFGIAGGPGGTAPNTQWEERHKEILDKAEAKKGLRVMWFGIGTEDFLLQTSKATVSMFKNHQFDVVSKETAGGHTWINWRNYLAEFAPLLFTETK
jgi:hypothetical protein